MITSRRRFASALEHRMSIVLPDVITDTTSLIIVSRFCVTDVIEPIGITSTPAPFLVRTPVASTDKPPVATAAVIFPPETCFPRSHSTRSGNTRTFAFFPRMCEVNSNTGMSFMAAS